MNISWDSLAKPKGGLLSLNWENLGYQPHDLSELENNFEEKEIKRIVMRMPAEKAPGPYAFIGLFYKRCWPIIRTDLIEALAFHSLKTI